MHQGRALGALGHVAVGGPNSKHVSFPSWPGHADPVYVYAQLVEESICILYLVSEGRRQYDVIDRISSAIAIK